MHINKHYTILLMSNNWQKYNVLSLFLSLKRIYTNTQNILVYGPYNINTNDR